MNYGSSTMVMFMHQYIPMDYLLKKFLIETPVFLTVFSFTALPQPGFMSKATRRSSAYCMIACRFFCVLLLVELQCLKGEFQPDKDVH